jgi:hypothetical protein
LLQQIRSGLVSHIPAQLVDELLAAYTEGKKNFYLGGLRLSAVEGGRFSEAAFRILQHLTTGKFTPLGKQIKSDDVILALSNLAVGSHPDSLRLHIPRALRVVYDIRNNRDAAHLADGIDPNLQDATLVVSVLDWVLAELVRLYHSISANEAQRIVENLVTRRAPAVEDFNGFLKVLNPALSASDHCLLLLYQRGADGATFDQMNTWARPEMRGNLRRTLHRLSNEKAFVHSDSGRYFVTETGKKEVESRRLFELSPP